jgi:hypothetical protein
MNKRRSRQMIRWVFFLLVIRFEKSFVLKPKQLQSVPESLSRPPPKDPPVPKEPLSP